ncbi:sensor histidine kinase [Tellurirhabdus rosea]|uniref:sensor histidine kinase n=1 Tax=Tellurirhabdus rosea TaxID=2674997 RepID=UPI00224EEB51|nr:sensor histidine kinase [Tellurirhabdus rosea]
MEAAIQRLSNQIAIGAFIVFSLVICGFGLSLFIHQREEQSNQWVIHTYQVIDQLKDVSHRIADAETGVRGYTLTGRDVFLTPYRTTKDSLPAHLQTLRTLVDDNPSQSARVGELQKLTAQKLAILDRQVKLKSKTDPAEVARLVETGRQISIRISEKVRVMIEVEQSLLKDRNRRAESFFQYTNSLSVVLLLFIFLILLVGYRRLRSELEKREQNEMQLRAYEATLEEKITELQRSNEDLQRFAYVASHDLQEPLRKIHTYISLIADSFAEDLTDNVRPYFERIELAAARSSALIRDLLTYSRVSNQKETFKKVNLQDLVGEVIDELDIIIREKQAQIEVGPLPELELMPGQIRHLFQNLLTNALKYQRPQVPPHIRIEARPVADGYEISVADNGIGFDEKYMAQIFEPFSRLHNGSVYKGTGIGLAICKKVVQSHGGTLSASSQLGQGATFTAWLPGGND